MNGMGGILDALVELLSALGIELRPWTLSVVALAVMAALLPFILKNLRTGRARKLLKRSRLLGGRERLALESEALDSVGDHPMGLVAIAEEALRMGATPRPTRGGAPGRDRQGA